MADIVEVMDDAELPEPRANAAEVIFDCRDLEIVSRPHIRLMNFDGDLIFEIGKDRVIRFAEGADVELAAKEFIKCVNRLMQIWGGK